MKFGEFRRNFGQRANPDLRSWSVLEPLQVSYRQLLFGPVVQHKSDKRRVRSVYLPLDDLALNGALLEWGHTQEALAYIRYFFSLNVCMKDVCIEPIVRQ